MLIKPLSKFAVLLSALCLSQAALAANAITDVSFETLPGDRLQLAIQMEGEAPEPLSFTINNPARIALDFQDTVSKVTKSAIPIGVGAISSVNVATQNERTRVIINLAELVSYDLQTNNNTLYVTLDDSVGGATSNISSLSSTPAAGGSNQSVDDDNSIDGVDFRRGDEGQGLVIVELASPNTPVNVVQEGNRIITEFVGAEIEDDMIQRLDVLDFATPAKFIDIVQAEDGVRIVTTPTDNNFEHIAYQSDNTFTLELKPIAKEELERQARDKFGYTGERLSLNFQDIEVRSVLQLIADFTGLNVVVSDTVSGSLTLRLKNVPWDQALDIILKTKGLDKRKSGNVLLIAPTEELAQQEKLALEAKQQVKELAPLQSEFFQINYAKASDILTLITGGEGSTITSERGTASVDERTNTLMVNDTAEVLEEVRTLIQRLDVAVKQVLIESRIVIASDEFDKQLGARFGVAQRNPNSGDLITSGSLNGTTQAINGETIEMNDRLNFNLPVVGGSAGGAGQLALALAKDDGILELELSALQAEGKGEIISTPRVITANQKEAFIEQGVEIPYLEASSSGAATVTFKKAVLSLTVTPQITPDDRIILDLTIKQDSVGEIFGGIPSINTRELETQVLVDNGETIVLGGIFEHENFESVTKVPFFGDLPGIGRLFRRTITQDQKREILVFVTPKIVQENMEFN